MEWLEQQSPVLQAFIATCFTYFVTALGASVVFFVKGFNRKFLDGMRGLRPV